MATRSESALKSIWSSVDIDVNALQAELMRRTWSLEQWATAAYVDPATASAFLKGKQVRPAKARALVEALGLHWSSIVRPKHLPLAMPPEDDRVVET